MPTFDEIRIETTPSGCFRLVRFVDGKIIEPIIIGNAAPITLNILSWLVKEETLKLLKEVA